MVAIKLLIDKGSGFYDLQGREGDIVLRSEPFTVMALARGTKSSNPALLIRIELPDNKVLVQETSAAAWVAIARSLSAKFKLKFDANEGR